MAILRPSALYAPTFDKKLQRMLDGHYSDPNFSTALLRKDLRLFLEEATAAGLKSSGLQGLDTLLEEASGGELDGLDYALCMPCLPGLITLCNLNDVMAQRTSIALLSGGLDSATAAALALEAGDRVIGLSFDYGQRHRRELEAAATVAEHLGLAEHHRIQVNLAAWGGSALTDAAIGMPTDGVKTA